MHQDDRKLVRRTLSGDREAFGALYDRHAARVFHLLRRLTACEAEAEDLTQETFLAAFGALQSWRQKGQLSTWLCGIAVRQYASARRRDVRRREDPLEDELPLAATDADPLGHCSRKETAGQLEAAILALPPAYREAFVLVKVEGLAYREAAEALGVPLGTVQSRLSRAIALLQAALRGAIEEGDGAAVTVPATGCGPGG